MPAKKARAQVADSLRKVAEAHRDSSDKYLHTGFMKRRPNDMKKSMEHYSKYTTNTSRADSLDKEDKKDQKKKK